MTWWYNQNDIRQCEDKNVLNGQLNNIRKRLENNESLSIKKSALLILKGIISAIVLTSFEYAKKNPEVFGILKTIFTMGFFISALLVLQLPYGLYQLIKRIYISTTNKKNDN
ncbi:hypothetical protein SAMN02745883_01743 [Caminicella sporogenes DSM 14501]|uniref:Uncharacterized protein n=1 Tax=Caminicella sporogenes DSM 14501 TaxID=1121266 RepID=A0A1M6R9D3_9FIRM|nr:hypothetical protein [Caminicella sporogenes]RKD27349.1 hypothetical protein BET04_09445 [Caminicella sporogenes]SHK29085.1 hypothetical protein SAMN02745883_01743 [Caminicella sporogenes DSM 14501]